MDKSTPQIEVILGITEIKPVISRISLFKIICILLFIIPNHTFSFSQIDSLTALKLHSLGVISYQNENYDIALSQYTEALNIRGQLFDNPHLDLARSNLNIGILLNVTDKFISAKNYLQTAISQYEILGQESLLATAYNEMGWCLQNLGDYNSALLYQQKAIILLEQMYGQNHFEVGYALGQLAITYDELGNHQKAIAVLLRSLKTHNNLKDSFEIAITLHNLGDAYDGNEDYNKAINNFKKAILIYNELGNDYLEESIFSLNNLSLVYAHKGEYDQAISLGDSVLQMKKDLFGLSNAEVAISLNNLGNFYDTKNDYDKAQAYYKDALEMIKNEEDPIFKLTIIHDQLISLIKSSNNNKENVTQLIDISIDLIHRQINTIKNQFNNNQTALYWISEVREIHIQILDYYLKQFQLTEEIKWVEQAFLEIERSKSLLLLEEFRKNQIENPSQLNYNQSERKIQSKIAHWSLASEEKDSSFVDSLFYWNNKLSNVKSKNSLLNSSKTSIMDKNLLIKIKKLFDIEVACINVLELNDSLMIVYVSNNLMELYKTSKPEAGFNQLHLQKVIDNLMTKKHLVVFPDGTMMNKSWETILISQDEKTTKYLIDEISISYHFSAQLLLESQKKTKNLNSQNTISFISPDFSDHRTLPLLLSAQKEWEKISPMFTNPIYYHQKSFKGFDFTQVKGDILHLSTHARGDTSSMYSSYLIWPESDSTIIKLYNWQIENMRLKHQLAVLASCETGLGKVATGEGMTNIGRSMMHAGVPNILISNWKANDVSTSQIMIDWYTEIAKGIHPAIALQEAKISYMDNPADETGAPYYWGHLTYWGDIPNYKSTKPHWSRILIPAVIILGLLFFLLRRFISRPLQEVPST